jgi:hypothetical protein
LGEVVNCILFSFVYVVQIKKRNQILGETVELRTWQRPAIESICISITQGGDVNIPEADGGLLESA